TRVAEPMVRAGWLERGPGPDDRRGAEPFVPLSWPEALDRVAAELARIGREHGPAAVFGGSYGWGSPGRFHHPKTQLHRFLAASGGFTRSVNTYTVGASEVLLPHVVGSATAVVHRTPSGRPVSPGSRPAPSGRWPGAWPPPAPS